MSVPVFHVAGRDGMMLKCPGAPCRICGGSLRPVPRRRPLPFELRAKAERRQAAADEALAFAAFVAFFALLVLACVSL